MLKQKKRWSDLTPTQQRGIILVGAFQLVLLAAALRDIRGRSEDEIHGSKRLWTAALFINTIGPLAYFLFGRKRQEVRNGTLL